MGRLVHTCLSSPYLIVHVLHCPPPPSAHSFIIGPAVINTHTLAREEPDGICSFCPIAGVARCSMEESCHNSQGEGGGAVRLWAICAESECREQNQLLVCSSRKVPLKLTFACLLHDVCLAANVEYTTSFYNHFPSRCYC